jgi:uncharacterized protein
VTKNKVQTRFDTAEASIISEGEGFLRLAVTIARPGVFPYLRGDGSVAFEAKLPEDILSPDTINSAKGVPVTDGHPAVGMVTPHNAKDLMRGALMDDVRKEGEFLVGTEVIHDADLIDSLRRGDKRQVSIGFVCDIDHTPGELSGQRYDAIQKNIKINHLAHVERGRAGEEVRAHFDSGDFAVQIKEGDMPQTLTYRADDGKDYQVPPEVMAEIKTIKSKIKKDEEELQAAQAQLEEVKKQVEAATSEPAPTEPSEVEKLKAENAKLQGLVDTLSDAVKKYQAELESASTETSTDELDKAVQDRMDLIDVAKAALPDFKADGLSNREIKLKVIDKVLPSTARLDSVDQYIIDARFDAAAELLRVTARTSQRNSGGVRVDQSSVEDKKNKRLNLRQEGK